MKYVYTHSYNDAVFYVGCGGKCRPFSKQRTAKWNKIVSMNKGEYKIDIIREFTSESEAFEFERNMIRDLMPEANVQCGDGIKHGDMKTIQTILNDDTYKTLRGVADLDKKTVSTWCREVIEVELNKRHSNRKGKRNEKDG